MCPELTYREYAGEVYRGGLDESAFYVALPAARARLCALTGTDVPDRCAEAWKRALCALVDRATERPDGVKSETVGSTSVTYTDERAGAGDLEAVAPYLAGTGLLYRGLA